MNIRDRNWVKQDALKSVSDPALKSAIENDDFYIAADVCVESGVDGYRNRVRFQLSGDLLWKFDPVFSGQKRYLVFAGKENTLVAVYNADRYWISNKHLRMKATSEHPSKGAFRRRKPMDRQSIKAELLAKTSRKKIRNAMAADDFRIVEDVCIDFHCDTQGDTDYVFKDHGFLRMSRHTVYFMTYIALQQRVYLVLGTEKWPSVYAIYPCSRYVVPDSELDQKVQPESVTKVTDRGLLTPEMIDKKWAEKDLCIYSFLYTELGWDTSLDSPSPEITLSDGQFVRTGTNLPIIHSTKYKHRNYSDIGICRGDLVYAVVYNDSKRIGKIYPAEEWILSDELTPVNVCKPTPKPQERQQYLQEIRPLVEQGYVREVYGSDIVSVLNVADYTYLITDYCKNDGAFLFAQMGCKDLRTVFRHPQELPLFLREKRQIRLSKAFREEVAEFFECTQEIGPIAVIDHELEQEIREQFDETHFDHPDMTRFHRILDEAAVKETLEAEHKESSREFLKAIAGIASIIIFACILSVITKSC